MKITILFLLFSLISINLSSQSIKEKFKVTSGPIDDSYNPPDNYLGKDEKGNMVFFQTKFGLYALSNKNFLWFYDSKLNRVKDKEIEWSEDQKDPGSTLPEMTNPKSIASNGSNYLIRSHVNDKSKEVFLNAYKYDPVKKDLVLSKKIVSLKAGRYKYKYNFFNISISPDSSKIAFYKKIEVDEKNGAKGYYLVVTDKDFNILWKDDLLIPLDEDLIKLMSLDVNNHGTVHTLIKEYFSGLSEKKNGEVNYTFHIFSKKGMTEKTTKNKVSIDDNKFISNPKITPDQNGNTVLAGFYGKTPFRQDGVFIASIDDDGVTKVNNYYEFDAAFLTETLRQKKAENQTKKIDEDERDKYSDANFIIQQFISDGSGGFYLTGEKYWVTTHTDSKGRTYTRYHHGDFMAIHFGSDYKVIWAKKIFKYYVQSNSNSSFGGFSFYFNKPFNFTMVSPEGVYCLYEDDEDRDDNRAYSMIDNLGGFDYALWGARLDANTGELKKEIIEDHDKRQGFFNDFSTIQVDGNVIYYFGSKAGLLQFDTRMKRIDVK